MLRFVERFRDQVLGVVHGLDRLAFHGVLRPLLVVSGMMHFVWKKQVLLKDFGPFVPTASFARSHPPIAASSAPRAAIPHRHRRHANTHRPRT